MHTPSTTSNASPVCDFDVVVAGYGPAGAIAALWLGQAGIRTLVIDKSQTIYQIPRAVAIDHEILRVLQNLGVADEILPHTAPFPASEHFGVDGQLIRRIHVVEPPYPLGYEEERKLHVHTLSSRIKAIGHHICERDVAAARERGAALLLQGGGQAPTVTRQEIVPPLQSGLLATSPHPANGTLFPQPWIVTLRAC